MPAAVTEAPIVVPSMLPPLMSTVLAVNVPEFVSSDKAMPASRRLISAAVSRVPSREKIVSYPVPILRAVEVMVAPGSVRFPMLIALTMSVPAEFVGENASISITLNVSESVVPPAKEGVISMALPEAPAAVPVPNVI